jgi:hypothetical protein
MIKQNYTITEASSARILAGDFSGRDVVGAERFEDGDGIASYVIKLRGGEWARFEGGYKL